MPLFSSDAERQRKENLKRLEDKRLRFAQELDARGFRPERMFFCSREDGSYVALARHEGRLAVIDAPRLDDADGEFALRLPESPRFEREDVFEKGSGLNGAFGFGVKGARGFNLYVVLDDGERVFVPVVFGRTSWLESEGRKNPLLQLKRRRGNANIVWDFRPIDNVTLSRIEERLEAYYLK